jgi:uncharacterized membrane protein YgcG
MRLLVALLLFVMTSVGGICAFQQLKPYVNHPNALGLTLFILTCAFIAGISWLVFSLIRDPDEGQHARHKGGRSSSNGSSDGFGGGFGDGGSGDGGGCGGGDGGGGGCGGD